MEARAISITNPDLTTTSVQVFGNPQEGNRPVIMIFPAMGVKAKVYTPFAEALAEAGYIAVTADLRGKGHSSVRPSKKDDYGYKEMIEQDIHSAVSRIGMEFPDRKLYLLGHSLGGQLACLYSSRGLSPVDGLILIACCSVFYEGWDGLARFRILMGTQFIGMLATAVGYFPGRRVGFGGTNSKSMMQDWSRQSRTGRYELNNDDFNYEIGLSRLAIPVLTISFEGDHFAPQKAVEILCDKFSDEASIRQIHLERKDARNESYNHFNWPKKPTNIVQLINDWSG
ncbi:MAG: alpha/beta fold hydrolase [Bacteroidetes bacterium]|nr:alpha/beta fold hydrolase [Bacteroidota bacterium]